MAASPTSQPPYERFGNFVLLAETERSSLATDYRAAHLGEKGFDRLVQLVRFAPACMPGAPDTMVEHVRAAGKVGAAGVLKALGTGRGGAAWLSYEYVGGRSLHAVLERGRHEGFPLSLDNALEIARQVCIALEKVHSRTVGGGPLVHGYLAPWSVMISFDGAVRLRGFGLWAGRALGGLPTSESGTLAPEQEQGQADVRTDVYGLGTLLLESLRGAPLPRGGDLRPLVAETNDAEGEPLPAELAATIERALSPRPEMRQEGPAALRQELEALLFAGDVAPTTFNLAFFMETLYRDTIEQDARAIADETHADYQPYLRGASPEPAIPEPAIPAPAVPEPVVSAPARPASPSVPAVAPIAPPPAPRVPAAAPPPAVLDAPPPPVARPAPAPDRPAPSAGARAQGPNRLPLIAAGVAALLLAGGGAYYFLAVRRPATPAAPAPTTLSPEAQAAVARVQELEARLAALEQERAQAEAAAAEAARQKVEAEAKARGRVVDPRAIERAEEEAARKVRLEQEKQQREERKRLEDQKKAEEARLAAATPPTTLPAVETPAPTTVAAAPAPEEAPPTTLAAALAAPAADPSTAPEPSVYDYGAPGLIPPVMVSQKPLEYPPVARVSRITGSVTVSAVVDEQGRVNSARATSGNPVLRKAAVDHIASRRYRPGQKDGVPVKVQMVFQVNFKG